MPRLPLELDMDGSDRETEVLVVGFGPVGATIPTRPIAVSRYTAVESIAVASHSHPLVKITSKGNQIPVRSGKAFQRGSGVSLKVAIPKITNPKKKSMK